MARQFTSYKPQNKENPYLTVKFDDLTMKRLYELSKQKRVSRASIVKEAVAQYLESCDNI